MTLWSCRGVVGKKAVMVGSNLERRGERERREQRERGRQRSCLELSHGISMEMLGGGGNGGGGLAMEVAERERVVRIVGT